ncbi:hypothetical protein [Treponema bryantii]|uniref:hypothetical protein n=1 Tax=Treponema bryantii TaxID=163 RepID=UPI0003B2F14A|nr:hypothetical protein [Treponema bryantii]
MNPYTKLYSELWQKKLESYSENLDLIESETYKKLDNHLYNWNLNMDLSDEITISMKCYKVENQIYYIFLFYGNADYKFLYNDTLEKVALLFEIVLQNFNQDNEEINKIIKPELLKENTENIENEIVKTFVQNQMNGSKYEWKIKDNTLLVKLKSQRILEVPLNTLVIKAYEKDYKTSNFIDIITKTDEQLDKIPFSVNIDNYISHWE